MGINLKGAFWGCKAAATAMSGNGGAIINISSIAGKRGSANNAVLRHQIRHERVDAITCQRAGSRRYQGQCALSQVLIRTDGLMDALATEHSPAKGDPEGFPNNFLKATRQREVCRVVKMSAIWRFISQLTATMLSPASASISIVESFRK